MFSVWAIHINCWISLIYRSLAQSLSNLKVENMDWFEPWYDWIKQLASKTFETKKYWKSSKFNRILDYLFNSFLLWPKKIYDILTFWSFFIRCISKIDDVLHDRNSRVRNSYQVEYLDMPPEYLKQRVSWKNSKSYLKCESL